jgi:hypothetical protein
VARRVGGGIVTDRDLAYWLQGAFEIAGLTAITDEQADTILRHVALVRVTAPRSLFAEQVANVVRNVKDPTARADTLRPVVAGHFLHVIDPAHPNPTAANAAHHRPDHGPILYRC